MQVRRANLLTTDWTVQNRQGRPLSPRKTGSSGLDAAGLRRRLAVRGARLH